MKILWAEPALDDAGRLRDYIALDQPFYAKEFTERLMTSVEPLADNPRMYRAVPEAKNDCIREVIFHGYRIIYQVLDKIDTIKILAIIHGSCDLDGLKHKPWST